MVISLLNMHKRLLMYSRRTNNARFEMDRWERSEEFFLVRRASQYYPEYRVPEVNVLGFGLVQTAGQAPNFSFRFLPVNQ